jgi:hypothetical protein
MERVENDGTILWKKIGGGSLRLGGKIIKPGQTFRATVAQIPKGSRDVVVPLEDVREKEAPPLVVTKSVYSLQARGKNELWFDVVDGNGKVLNEKALRKDVAEKLIEDLSK